MYISDPLGTKTLKNRLPALKDDVRLEVWRAVSAPGCCLNSTSPKDDENLHLLASHWAHSGICGCVPGWTLECFICLVGLTWEHFASSFTTNVHSMKFVVCQWPKSRNSLCKIVLNCFFQAVAVYMYVVFTRFLFFIISAQLFALFVGSFIPKAV